MNPGTQLIEQAQKKMVAMGGEQLKRIEKISLWLSQARTPSFYFEQDYTETDAKQAFEDARDVDEKSRFVFLVSKYSSNS